MNDPEVKKKYDNKGQVVVRVTRTRKIVNNAYYLESNKLDVMSTRRVRFSNSFYVEE
jgi:hypothetical protein